MSAGASYNVIIAGSSSEGVSLVVMELHVVESIDLSDVGVQGGLGTILLSILKTLSQNKKIGTSYSETTNLLTVEILLMSRLCWQIRRSTD